MTQMFDAGAFSPSAACLSDAAELEAALGHVDHMAVALMGASPDCIKLLDLDGNLLFMSANGQCAMQIDDFDALRGAKWSDLWPEPMQGLVSRSLATPLRGGMSRFVGQCPTARGEMRVWDVMVTPVLDRAVAADKSPVRLLSTSRDVTAQYGAGLPERGIPMAGFRSDA